MGRRRKILIAAIVLVGAACIVAWLERPQDHSAPASIRGDGDNAVSPAFADEQRIVSGADPERVIQSRSDGANAAAGDVE